MKYLNYRFAAHQNMANLIPQESKLPCSEAEYMEKVSHRRAEDDRGGSAGSRAPRRCRGASAGVGREASTAARSGADGATVAGCNGHDGRAPPDLEAAQTVGIGITFSVDGEWATVL